MVGRILSAVRQVDIEIGGHFSEGEILGAVQADDKHVGLILEDGGVAVALVYVEIEYGNALHHALLEQRECSDREVVENAEAGTEIAVRMVCAAGELAGDALRQRCMRSCQRAPNRGARAPHQRFAPRQTDAAHDVRGDCAIEHGGHVGRTMRAQQIGRLRWWRGMKRGARQDLLALDRRLEQAVFYRRKAMSCRKRQLLEGGEEKTHVAIPSICRHKSIPVWRVGELSTRSTAYVYNICSRVHRPRRTRMRTSRNPFSGDLSMKFKLAIAGLLTATLLSPPAVLAQSAPQIRVGVLNCNVAGGAGFVFGSSKQLDCVFESGQRRERYHGVINKFGLDLGVTSNSVIAWAVLASTDKVGPGSLAGTYGGVSGEASVGVGLGANALLGGSNRSIGLQPLSVGAQQGLNVAVGIAALELRPG
jgi:hypothetical protein